MRSECTSYYENIHQKNIWANRIFFLMSTSRRGLRVKYHDIVRVRQDQKKLFIERSLKLNVQCSTNMKFIDNTMLINRWRT